MTLKVKGHERPNDLITPVVPSWTDGYKDETSHIGVPVQERFSIYVQLMKNNKSRTVQ